MSPGPQRLGERRETERDRETERERQRETERGSECERERETERGSERVVNADSDGVMCAGLTVVNQRGARGPWRN